MKNTNPVLLNWYQLTVCTAPGWPLKQPNCYMLGSHHVNATYCEKMKTDPLGRIWGLLPPLTMTYHHDAS